MRSGHLHPAWRAFRRNQRILAVALPFPFVFLALFATRLSEPAIIALLSLWSIATAVPFFLVTRSAARRASSCGS